MYFTNMDLNCVPKNHHSQFAYKLAIFPQNARAERHSRKTREQNCMLVVGTTFCNISI